MKPTVTPLRYPGGKTWILPYVKQFLKYHNINLGTIIEPFAGSASVSIGLLSSGIVDRAVLCEKDPLITSFWRSVLYRNEDFIDSVKGLQISMETWYDFKKYLEKDAQQKYDEIDLGVAFLFYNRVNYSGIIKAGPIGGKNQSSKYKIQCRFNIDRIVKKLRGLSTFADNIEVVSSDGIDYLQNYSFSGLDNETFVYVDPPYYKAGKVLYRNYFKDEEHIKLSNIVTKIEDPWLVSYDESEFIAHLYETSKFQYVYTDYQAGNLRRGIRELLISNRKVPPTDFEGERTQINSVEEIIEL